MDQVRDKETQYIRLDPAAERVKILIKDITRANDKLDTDGKLVEHQ